MRIRQLLAVVGNRLSTQLWSLCVKRRVITYDDADIIAEIAGQQPWETFWKSFTADFSNRFFFSPRNRKDFFVQTLESLSSYDDIVEDANGVASREFDLLGSGPVTLGAPLAWNADFKSGATWADEWYTRIRRSNDVPFGDIKVPWELGRFQYLTWLGKGYWVSNSRRYAETFRDLVSEWIAANPMCRGIQWNNAMEVAIRGCNWMAGMAFFLEEPTLTPEFWQAMLATMWKHAEFIEDNLEVTRRSGNHLIADYTGLVFLGSLFSHTIEGERWFVEGVRGMEREILRQTTPDGVDYEMSIAYHRFVAEMGLAVLLLCRHRRVPFSPEAEARIEAMCAFAAAYSRDDGSVPNIGDNDDGRLFRVGAKENVLDHHALLSTAAVAFRRSDFKSASRAFAEESLWLTGSAGWETYQALDARKDASTKAFRDSGFYILRSPTAHCVVDVGELGKQGWGGHGHNDTLGFEMWRGVPVIVDCGTYCYTSDAEARSYFRSTAQHNTAVVDGKEIAEFSGPFKIKRDLTSPEVHVWESTNEWDILKGAHSAYTELSDPVTHMRTFKLNRLTDALTIIDQFLCGSKHSVSLRFHIAPGLHIEHREPRMIAITGAQLHCLISCSHPLSLEECWESPSYGIRIRSMRVNCDLSITGPATIETHINFH